MSPQSQQDPRRRGGVATMPGYRNGQQPPNAGRRFPAEVLTRAEVQAVLAAFSRRGSAGIRNAAMTMVAWRCGLRLAELLALEPKDVALERRTLTVLHGKGDKARTLGLDAETVAMLERWMRRRHQLGIGPRARLFCQIQGDRRGRPMAPSGYREALKVAGEAAGVAKRVHPHGLRHTFAFDWMNEGRPVHLLQAALGHTSLATTNRYTSHVAPVALVREMHGRARAPRRRRPPRRARSCSRWSRGRSSS
jgi:site-specific recombinase XerD